MSSTRSAGLGEAQAFEVMTYAYALDSQGNRILLAASPARADVMNGTLLDGIEVPDPGWKKCRLFTKTCATC